jgi:hypothetical protein
MSPTDLPAQAGPSRSPIDPRRDAIAVVAGEDVRAAGGDHAEASDAATGPFVTMVLTLAMYDDDLDPDDVSRRMGCAPTRARRKGERPGGALATHASSPYPIGAWALEVRGDSLTSADELVERLLGRFPLEPSFWAPFNRDFAVQLRLAVHPDAPDAGFILSSAALARCTATGASMLVSFHGRERALAAARGRED